jgi:hypothetical protein
VDHRQRFTVYRCVVGRAPFAAHDTPSLLYTVVHQMPLRPSAIAQVSPELLAMAKDRDARVATAS